MMRQRRLSWPWPKGGGGGMWPNLRGAGVTGGWHENTEPHRDGTLATAAAAGSGEGWVPLPGLRACWAYGSGSQAAGGARARG